ncbi:MAG: tetratricopeptide repeat protein [Actinomycetota bacterium]
MNSQGRFSPSRTVFLRSLAAATFLIALGAGAVAQPPIAESSNPGITITTKSPQARAYFVQGLAECQTLHLRAGFQLWRKAAEADPNFALAHILLSNFSRDPAERVTERQKALAARPYVSREEQLIIDWLSDSSQGKWVPAIQAMNEALEKYGNHKIVVWLGGMWLDEQRQWSRAIVLYKQALQLDPNFPDAWNSLAYCYARTGDFDKASQAMQRYADLLPGQPNPHDSYGEILMMAGRYQQALAEYHTALKLDPGFVESQRGAADTLAVMGKEREARQEYAAAIARVNDKAEAERWSLLSAATWVRQDDLSAAASAFHAVAASAHQNGDALVESEAWRSMALFATSSSDARHDLQRAEHALRQKRRIPESLRRQELASILRVRVERAVQDKRMTEAARTLKRLEKLSAGSSDGSVRLYYEAAAGAVAVAQGRYPEALSDLDENDRDLFSLIHLEQAYEKTGSHEDADRIAEKLAYFNEPTIEQAVLSPQFRNIRGNGRVEGAKAVQAVK